MHQIQVIIDWGGFAVNTWYFTLQNLCSEFCSILHYMHCFYWNLTNSLCYNSLVWLGRTARFLNQAALLRNPVKSIHYQMPNCDLHSTMFLDFIRDHNDITTVHQSLVFPVFLPFIRVYHDIIIYTPQCISHCICFAFKMISVFYSAGCTNHFYPSYRISRNGSWSSLN